MSRASGAPEGAGSKQEGEGQPALFGGSAGSTGGPPGGGRTALIVAAVVVAAGVVLGVRALRTSAPLPAPSASARPAPQPVDVPEGATARVAGGTFKIGSNEGDPDEKPITAVTVAPFELDLTEVTVAAYAKCVTAGKCSEPDTGMYCNWKKPDHTRHPVNCVDWSQATDYCAFVTKRLPTEEEWEFAARGADGRAYPWKEGAPADQLCWNGEGSDQGKGNRQGTCAVASYPAGRSSDGVFDMAGNVWEWTSSPYCPYDHRGCAEEKRVIRGGGWNNLLARYVRAQDRSTEAQKNRPDNVGFRCAKNP